MHRAAPILAFLGVLWAPPAAPAAGRARPEPPHVPGELIVGFRDGAVARHEAEIRARTAGAAIALIRFPATDDLTARQAAYLARPDVVFAHPNYLGRVGFVPEDTSYDLCWHHRNVGQSGGTVGADVESEPAWDVTRGNATVIVAVLDSGVDLDHPDLAGRIVAGWDFVNGDALPDDDHGHGTQVTGILAANAGNSFGVAGVDHFCSVMPLKVIDAAGVGTTFDLIQGLDRARTGGANVVNMSLINYPLSSGLTAALQATDGVPPHKPNDFEIASADLLTDLWQQLTGAIVLLTLIVASIALLVGGIGVMNIMLVSVTERTQEIGVRKAVGARRKDIRAQFLMEAVTLTSAGGVIGILIGIAVSVTIAALFPTLPARASFFWTAMGLLISLSVGLFFGLYPAVKASNLDPVSCLRYE